MSKKLNEMLNKAIARELQVSIQYMWQHVQWKGTKGYLSRDVLKKISIEEMKHAEAIAERLFYLGDTPTTKPDPIYVGKDFKEMMEQDKKDEENAIKMYKEIIKLAQEEEDWTTETLFKKILAEEEEHLDTFQGLLEEK